ncbi:probable sodium/potassium/calcium exchanger CG1090 [Lingula anatina]|uniref:Probable sodium/potassium/calcium exchanger CG1090 n=1 Tax=Lingula anatina TaxID=7574 RepID=A0A2R2MPG6_LINAN|nr:probable sodium/potassium/calcium exchanger CG1090 [Lingula anatina]|eukprot:XP_023932130.1 probable sodium/potassium/calcium exchanger CG1090 [Lingula anatina]
MRYRNRRYIRGTLFLLVLGGFALWRTALQPDAAVDTDFIDDGIIIRSDSIKHASRKLLAMPNCSPSAIEQFPRDIFTLDQKKSGALVVHILVALYMFLALAIVCDDYFVPSLEMLCEALNLQSDIAGATFMAAGSSAPELAASVIGVFIAKNDIGLGTVVGSAVFNIMFVISICALFAGMVVYLNWWPLFRDCVFYTISIIALVLVILDEEVKWYESLTLLALYAVYLIIMYFNPSLEAWVNTKVKPCHDGLIINGRQDPEKEKIIYEKLELKNTASGDDSESDGEVELYSSVSKRNLDKTNGHAVVIHGTDSEVMVKQHTHLDDEPHPFKIPEGHCGRFLWVCSLPLNVFLFITVPDCRRENWKKWFMVTFIMSMVWISAYSYLLVWMITIIGYTLNIPDTMMSITFLAAGVSVPDAIASLLVVRDGYGDMAVSNAVGSNVFDILLCLGLPWFLDSCMHGLESIEVYSEGLTYSSLTLLSTVMFLLVATHLNGWKLDRKFGIVLMLVYVLFMVLASLYELNVFGYFHPPECPVLEED